MKNNMTGGQLTQIYTIATQQGCGQDAVQFLIESGYMADFFAGRWQEVDRTQFRKIAKLAPEDFGIKPDWKTWRTVKLGTGLKTADDFRKAHKKADCKIDDGSNDILGKPAFEQSVAEKEMEVELVKVRVDELGFEDGATRADIYKRAQELGLDLCPAEVGPQLRLQYTDQPEGEWVVIAMEPITGSRGDLRVFCVLRGDVGVQWLDAHNGDSGGIWDGGRFVFVRRK